MNRYLKIAVIINFSLLVVAFVMASYVTVVPSYVDTYGFVDRPFAVPGIILAVLSLIPYVVYMVNKSDYDSSYRSFINRGYVIKKALEASKSNAELTAACIPDAIKWNKDLADWKSEYVEWYSDKNLLTMEDLTW